MTIETQALFQTITFHEIQTLETRIDNDASVSEFRFYLLLREPLNQTHDFYF